MNKIKFTFCSDTKLFVSLIIWSLFPSIYMLFRMNVLQINNVDINIMGQLEWFDLVDEVFVTTLIVPLYSLLKSNETAKNRTGLAFLISFGVYVLFTGIVAVYISSITEFMNATFATTYLKLQTVSMLISFICTFAIMLFTLRGDYKTVAVLTVTKLIILAMCDSIFIKLFAELGASYSEITVNTIVAIIAIIILLQQEYILISVPCSVIEIAWLKDYFRIGAFAGIQIFLDNFIYAIMICKMVNAVSESGNYWAANNFIWGWLLVPVTCAVEIIKKNHWKRLTFKNTWRVAIIIVVIWMSSVPLWRWFISGPMACEADIMLQILYPLVPFYITYIVSAFIDAWFIARGKTIYNAINSFLVNIVYYGKAYILFKQGLFETNMMFIILLFGFGMVFHMMISIVLYFLEQKCLKQNK